MFQKLLIIALAGAVGTLARYGLGRIVDQIADADFPWATWVINGLGSLLFGVVFVMATERRLLSDEGRIVVLIGFMGAFTTFSSLAYECAALIRAERYFAATIHIVGQNAFGVALMFGGFALGRLAS